MWFVRVFNSTSQSLSLVEFLTGVGQLKFRGTSHLLRSPIGISTFLKSRRTLVADSSKMPVTFKKSNTGTILGATDEGRA